MILHNRWHTVYSGKREINKTVREKAYETIQFGTLLLSRWFHSIICAGSTFFFCTHIYTGTPVFALRFQNLPARNLSLQIFKHEKEGKLAGPKGKLAGPAQFLVAEGLGPALNAKTGTRRCVLYASALGSLYRKSYHDWFPWKRND